MRTFPQHIFQPRNIAMLVSLVGVMMWTGRALTDIDIPTDLLDKNNGADYLILTPEEFENHLYPLAVHHSFQGMRVDIVLCHLVAEQFGDSTLSDSAIRDFVDYAYHNWSSAAPHYLLIAGDVELIPSHPVNPDSTYHSDTWFACITGDDYLPELAVGRFPIDDTTELRTVVSKTLSYMNNPVPGEWRKDILLIADDDTEPGGDFERFCEYIADSLIPADYVVSRVYVREDSPYHGTAADVIDEIDEGCLVAYYHGHGAAHTWAHERVFLSRHIDSLENDMKLPIVLMATACQQFGIPGNDCMSEDFVTASNRGAVASLAPCGATYAVVLEYLSRGLFNNLFSCPDCRMGDIVLEAMSDPYGRIETLALMGDPGLKIAFFTGLDEDTSGILRIALESFPNPFDDRTVIKYALCQPSAIRIVIYNLSGQEVATLVNEYQGVGRHTITWDATDDAGRRVPSGTYFLRLTIRPAREGHTGSGTCQQTATRKVSVVR